MNMPITTPVRIVMIEDDEGHARLIEKNIRRAGVNNEIVSFVNGRDGLDFIHNCIDPKHPHRDMRLLVLLDLNLPDMNGFEVLETLKGDDRTRHIPIIILTTTDDKLEVQRCYDLGCSAYVKKPLEYEAFANSVRQLGLFFSIIELPPA